MKKKIESVLKTAITDNQFLELKDSWKAFVQNPEKYAGSIIIDMIQQWLAETH